MMKFVPQGRETAAAVELRAETADGCFGTYTLASCRSVKSLSIFLCLLAACGLALAKEVPLPRERTTSADRLLKHIEASPWNGSSIPIRARITFQPLVI